MNASVPGSGGGPIERLVRSIIEILRELLRLAGVNLFERDRTVIERAIVWFEDWRKAPEVGMQHAADLREIAEGRRLAWEYVQALHALANEIEKRHVGFKKAV